MARSPAGSSTLHEPVAGLAWWRGAVLVTPIALSAVSIGRIGLLGNAQDVMWAIGVTMGVLPLHLCHLWFGVRGQRAPYAGVTLAAMVVLYALGFWALGFMWVYMMAVFATSALAVFRPPMAAAAFVACGVVAVAASRLPIKASIQDAGFDALWFVVSAYVFQYVLLSSAIWLLAAASRLAAARPALMAARAVRERARLGDEINAALARRIDQLVILAEAAAMAPSGGRLDRVASAADATLARMRDTVARSRRYADIDAVSVEEPSGPMEDYFVTRRAWLIAGAVYAVVVGFPLLRIVATNGPTARSAFAAAAWAACATVIGWIGWEYAAGRQPTRRSRVALVFLVVAFLAGSWIVGYAWNVIGWFAAAASVMVLRGARRFVGAGLCIAVLVGVESAAFAETMSSAFLTWQVFYAGVGSIEAVAALVASAALVRTVARLADSRADLLARAADDTRLRISAELHDVLGQTLTAISLKADLAKRLADRDPARAAAEVTDILAISRRQHAELSTVVAGDRPVELAAEIDLAAGLLRDAGIHVELDVDLDDLATEPGAAVLAWAVREATTNIIRHAQARRVVITARRVADEAVVEVTNDGRPRSGGRSDGQGLAGLAHRVEAEHGRFDAIATEPDGFRVRVTLPYHAAVSA